MADNKTFQTGTLATLPNATVVATDEIAGVDWQKVKLADGTADSTTMIAAGNGVHGGALRVTLASDGTGVVAATQSGTWNVGTVSTITNVVHVDDNSGSLTVDGTVAATQSGTWNIGTVSTLSTITNVVHVDDNGGSLTVDGTFWQATQPVSGPLTDTQLRATPVPVSGTVTATPSAATVSTVNSTTSVLAGGAVFTGTAEDVSAYAEIRVSVIASHASATDGLSIQQSSNGTNWDFVDTYTIPATTGKVYVVPRQAQFFRVVYTNGGTLQTSFRLQTIFNRIGASALSSQRAADAYTNETDLAQAWAFNSLYNGTTWDRMRGDITNGLDVDVTRVTGGATASGASLTNNPLTVGGLAKTANPTAVTDGQVVNALFDKLGKLVSVPALRDLKGFQTTTITASTAETTIITAVASTFLDLYGLMLTNTGSTATKVSIRDDTAGTVRIVLYVPAGATAGFTLEAGSAMPQTAVNKNWTATCGTSTSSLEVTALYVKNT